MKILIVNTGVVPVKLYGGTERVIWYLGKELVKMGHQVTYLVNKGSSSDFANIIPIDWEKGIAEQIPEDIDIVHFNFVPDDLDKVTKPYVITMHGNINSQKALDINTIFVSKNHAERFGSVSYVYNGMDWDDYMKPDLKAERNYYHFLGNAAWRVKNVQGAINVVRKTKRETLKVLGGVRFNFKMGMRFTFSPRISFYGMVGGQEKDTLLRSSKGLIFPVKWHEPFGLAITESLYFGCPVFGTPYGSLKEIVTDEVGFLSNNEDELVQAVESNSFSNKICHEYALEKFNAKEMALAYLGKYEKVLAGENLNAQQPKLKEVQQVKFLDWN